VGNGTIERAELVAAVDDLVAWKKSFEPKQRELIEWQQRIDHAIAELQASIKTTLEGCHVMMDTDTLLGDRSDELGQRVDIVNKRLRRIEDAVKQLQAITEPGQ